MTNKEKKEFERLVGDRIGHYVWSEITKAVYNTYCDCYEIDSLEDFVKDFPEAVEKTQKEFNRYMEYIIPYCVLQGGFVRVFFPFVTIPTVDGEEEDTYDLAIDGMRIIPEDINYDLLEEDKVTIIHIEDDTCNYEVNEISAGNFEVGGTYINVCDLISLYNVYAEEEGVEENA